MRYSTFGLMNAPSFPIRLVKRGAADSSLAARLRKEIEGEVMFDAASRGRYSTDASIYQVEPLGVVVPRTEEAARTALAIALEAGVPVLPRGAGTSQCGQTVGEALVIDHSKYLNQILEVDAQGSTAYGNMVHNVLAIEAVTAAGERWRFGPMGETAGSPAYRDFVKRLKALYDREKDEIEARFPKLLRKVAGYNLDHLGPPHANAAHLLVGSEGTLAYSE